MAQVARNLDSILTGRKPGKKVKRGCCSAAVVMLTSVLLSVVESSGSFIFEDILPDWLGYLN